MEEQNQGRPDQTSPSMAGGFFIFIGLIVGVAVGIYTGEISIGMISGFGLGILAAIALWIFDRARVNREQ